MKNVLWAIQFVWTVETVDKEADNMLPQSNYDEYYKGQLYSNDDFRMSSLL
jgi:hypothetical protein